jgi:uncharacterized SAM-binding protein YcdF (DUF218 family)
MMIMNHACHGTRVLKSCFSGTAWMQKILSIGCNDFSRWVLAAVLLVMLGGFILFPLYVQNISGKCTLQKTDGIVVFTGEIDRENAAWQAYNQGLAGRLHISGRYIGFPKNRYPKAISIDFAPNTLCNVQLTKQWIHRHHLKSIRLVTSDYHMPRCLLLARHWWPEVIVIAHPVHVSYPNSHSTCLMVWAEYIRYIVVMMGCWLRL